MTGKSWKKTIDGLKDTASFRGASGDFPEGKLTEDDEGGLYLAVGEADGNVILDFGTQVVWFGMRPQQAADLASSLLRRAREIGRAQGITIEFRM